MFSLQNSAPHSAPLWSTVLDLVGNTPMCRLKSIGSEFSDISFLAKAEWLNPSGSVKDRAAYSIIRAAERSGELTRDKIILDATSGNNGTSLAMLGSAAGYRVTMCIPESVSLE